MEWAREKEKKGKEEKRKKKGKRKRKGKSKQFLPPFVPSSSLLFSLPPRQEERKRKRKKEKGKGKREERGKGNGKRDQERATFRDTSLLLKYLYIIIFDRSKIPESRHG